MATDLVPAIWRGPYAAETPGALLFPGDEHMVSEEDLKSGHWEAIDVPAPPAPTVSTPIVPPAFKPAETSIT